MPYSNYIKAEGLASQPVFQAALYNRPFAVYNAVIYRMADGAVSQDHVITENPLPHGTDTLQGSLGALIT